MEGKETRDSSAAGWADVTGAAPDAALTLSLITMGLIGAPFEARLWRAIGATALGGILPLGHLLALLLLLLARAVALALLPLSAPAVYLLVRREHRKSAQRYAARIAAQSTDSDVFLGL